MTQFIETDLTFNTIKPLLLTGYSGLKCKLGQTYFINQIKIISKNEKHCKSTNVYFNDGNFHCLMRKKRRTKK